MTISGPCLRRTSNDSAEIGARREDIQCGHSGGGFGCRVLLLNIGRQSNALMDSTSVIPIQLTRGLSAYDRSFLGTLRRYLQQGR